MHPAKTPKPKAKAKDQKADLGATLLRIRRQRKTAAQMAKTN
jgi:hypothetical protein